MAELAGPLWEHNLARVVIVDVSDDYRLMQPPMPSDCYPVLAETWLPRHRLDQHLAEMTFLSGYLYDWHECAKETLDSWYVGVVDAELARCLLENQVAVPRQEAEPVVLPSFPLA